MTLAELPGNPFEDNVVFEPREAEPAVPGLNDGPLHALLRQFARLETESLPRRQAIRLKAQLVTSAEPGYGKSHLIGRLFGVLQARATLVYLPPFQDAGSSWRSILLRMVQELHRPRRWRAGVGGNAGEPTQLDALACHVLSHLLAALIDREKVVGEEAVQLAADLRRDPLGAFGGPDNGHYLAVWLCERFAADLRGPLIEELQKSGVGLHAPASAWLKVLHAYAFGERQNRRAACLEWIKGEGLSDEERALISLETKELPALEETAAKRNLDAWMRVEDLCALAGFYQPFLLCFDQTDLYADQPERAAEFGGVVETLARTGLNQMTVVTANVGPWTSAIVRNFQTAYRDRFSEPLELSGITRPQAENLARQRLQGCGLDAAETGRFFESGWLDDTFRDQPTRSTREFLRRCARRCALLAQSGAVLPEKTMADHYSHYEGEVRARTDWRDFNPDVLRWSVDGGTVGDTLAGVVAEPFKDRRGYFPVRWQMSDGSLLLGFEDSSNSARWRAILHAAQRLAVANTENAPGTRTRVAMLRAPKQPVIPKKGWTVIGRELEGARELLTIHTLADEALLTVCSCYELYVNVVEGNAPFDRQEALDFVRDRLRPWWQTLLDGPVPVPPPPSPAPTHPDSSATAAPPSRNDPLAAQVRQIVETKLFLSLEQLTASLDPASADAVLAVCRTLPEIHVFATSQATILKWRSSP